jgi:hypothetical protein
VIPLSSQPPDLPECAELDRFRGKRAARRVALFSLKLELPTVEPFFDRETQMSTSSAALQAILDNPRYHDYLAILKGARNGLVYGFKVRFPHALIMAILFGRGKYV